MFNIIQQDLWSEYTYTHSPQSDGFGAIAQLAGYRLSKRSQHKTTNPMRYVASKPTKASHSIVANLNQTNMCFIRNRFHHKTSAQRREIYVLCVDRTGRFGGWCCIECLELNCIDVLKLEMQIYYFLRLLNGNFKHILFFKSINLKSLLIFVFRMYFKIFRP